MRTTECWEVPRSVVRRVPTEFGADNEPVRFMAGDRDPFLHTPGSSGVLHVGERVVLEGATFEGRVFSMVYATILFVGDDGFVKVSIGERWNVREGMLAPAHEVTDSDFLHPRTMREAPWGTHSSSKGPAACVAACLPSEEPAEPSEAAGAPTSSWGSYLVFAPDSGTNDWIRTGPSESQESVVVDDPAGFGAEGGGG